MFCVCDMMLMPAVIRQLWRLLVASAVCPGPWVTQERTDEGERVEYESRQLGGFQMCCRRGDDGEGKSKAVWVLEEQFINSNGGRGRLYECLVKRLRGSRKCVAGERSKRLGWNGVQSLQGKLSDDDCLRPGS
jgi:hypothetical protein